MITGRQVTVHRPVYGEPDAFGAKAVEWSDVDVDNVLFGDPRTSEPDESNRPDAIRRSLRLHFPKTFTDSLAGCHVTVEGVRYRIVGDPMALMDENTPGQWNRPADVEVVDG